VLRGTRRGWAGGREGGKEGEMVSFIDGLLRLRGRRKAYYSSHHDSKLTIGMIRLEFDGAACLGWGEGRRREGGDGGR